LAEEDPREGLTAFEEVLDLASKLKKKDDEEKNWLVLFFSILCASIQRYSKFISNFVVEC
jgi:hypothetical protein